jgi:hypothetical protein
VILGCRLVGANLGVARQVVMGAKVSLGGRPPWRDTMVLAPPMDGSRRGVGGWLR